MGTPRNYDGTRPPGHDLKKMLPKVLGRLGRSIGNRPDLILAAWGEVVGPRLSPMAEAVRFEEGVLFVKVKNSTLLSLLAGAEKPRLLKSLRGKFPKVTIKNIVFRIG